MKYILFFFLSLMVCDATFAQWQWLPVPAVVCSYDDAGNRILRKQKMVWVLTCPGNTGIGNNGNPSNIRLNGTGADQELAITNTHIYPNPCVSEMFVAVAQDLASSNESPTLAQVYDLAGRLVKEQSLSSGINRLDVSDLTAGTYPVIIRKEGEVLAAEKIVISK